MVAGSSPGGGLRLLTGLAGRGSRICPLGIYQALEPLDLEYQGLTPVLEQGTPIPVQIAAGSGVVFVKASHELRATPFQEGDPSLRGKVPCEGEPEREGSGAVSPHLVIEEAMEEGIAIRGQVVDLARSHAAGFRGDKPPGVAAESRTFPTQRAGQGYERAPGLVWVCRLMAQRHRHDGPRGLEAGERRVQRAEGEVREYSQTGPEPLAQLVAVKILLLEESKDGELQHERDDISL